MDKRLEIRSSILKNIILSLSGILMTLMSGFMLLAGLLEAVDFMEAEFYIVYS